jgi:hypothetical protein
MAGRNGGSAGAAVIGSAGSASSSISHDVSRCMPCQAAQAFTGMLEACCTADQKCGVDVSGFTTTPSCAEQNAPGAQSAACPSADYMGFFTIPGCCAANGICGLLIQQLAPLGCAQGSDLASTFGIADTKTRCTP